MDEVGEKRKFRELLDSLKERIKDAKKKLDSCQTQDTVVLIGNTGAGKSTLFCGLTNEPLLAQKHKLKMSIVCQKGEGGGISNESASKTKFINSVRCPLTKQGGPISVCDTPGFGDTGSIGKQGTFENDAGGENIKNSALIRYVLQRAMSRLILVLDFHSYQDARDTAFDPFALLDKMIPNLIGHVLSIGIVITKAEEDYDRQEVINIVQHCFEKKPGTFQLIQKIKDRGHVIVLNRPSKELDGKRLPSNYFDSVASLIRNLQGHAFNDVKPVLQNSDAREFINKQMYEVVTKLHQLVVKEQGGCSFSSTKATQNKEKAEIEKSHITFLEYGTQLDSISQGHDENQKIHKLLCIYNEMLQSMKTFNQNQQQTTNEIEEILETVKQISHICEIQKECVNRLSQEMYSYISKWTELYIRHTTEAMQNDPQTRYDLPEDSPKLRMLVARRKQTKMMLEKGFDFLLTFGNDRYEECYFLLHKRGNGRWFIEERVYVNEYNCASFRFKREFDSREAVRQSIEALDKFARLFALPTQEGTTNLERERLLSDVKRIVGEEEAERIIEGSLNEFRQSDLNGIIKNNNVTGSEQEAHLSNAFAVGGAKVMEMGGIAMFEQGAKVALVQVGKEAQKNVAAQVAKEVAAVGAQEVYKIVNNALVKEGFKGFMGIGGKKMMTEGAKVVVTQAGKEIQKGLVLKVAQDAIVIGAEQATKGVAVQAGKQVAVQASKEVAVFGAKQVASTALSMGIGLAVNAVLGATKAAINTKWEDKSTYICEIVSQDFDLGLLPQPEKHES